MQKISFGTLRFFNPPVVRALPSGSSLSQALAFSCRSGQIQVAGDRARLRLDLSEISNNPELILGQYAVGSGDDYRQVTMKYDAATSLMSCEYGGRCLQWGHQPPRYPGDDGLYCVRHETGILNRVQF